MVEELVKQFVFQDRKNNFYLAKIVKEAGGYTSGIFKIQKEGERLFTMHYYTDDNYYDDWDLWFWKDGGSGSAVKFTNKEDYGVNAQIDLNSDEYVGSTKFYFIVRRGNWEKKDATDKNRELEINE